MLCFDVVDIDKVFDVVYVVVLGWGKIVLVEWVVIFNMIVDCIDKNVVVLVVVEVWDNGKLVWEVLVVDILLVVDYFWYFVVVICV